MDCLIIYDPPLRGISTEMCAASGYYCPVPMEDYVFSKPKKRKRKKKKQRGGEG
jgi:hypothetical protein